MNTAIGVYAAYFGAIAVASAAVSLAGEPVLVIIIFMFAWMIFPSYHETPKLPDRPLTDAEAKSQMVARLTAHLESEERSNNGCGDDCPVSEILKKVASP